MEKHQNSKAIAFIHISAFFNRQNQYTMDEIQTTGIKNDKNAPPNSLILLYDCWIITDDNQPQNNNNI